MRKTACLAVTLCLFGCEPVVPEDVAADVEALNGTATTPDCDAHQRDVILAAMTVARDALRPGGAADVAVRESVMAWTGGATPEGILRRMRENLPTEVRCVAPGACGIDTDGDGDEDVDARACASIGISSERLKIETSEIDPVDPAVLDEVRDVAGIILHEVAHNKGFEHPPTSDADHDFTVPETIELFASVAPELWRPVGGFFRTDMVFETELPVVGGPGGLPFELPCGSNDFARGLVVDSSATRINRLGVRCRNSSTALAGMQNDSTQHRDASCPAGSLVFGVIAYAGATVNGLVGLCGRESDLRAGSTAISDYLLLGGGTEGPDVVVRACPPRMGVKRVYGRAGGRIDNVRLVCERIEGPKQGLPHDIGIVGQPLGVSARNHCLGNGVLVGLHGRAGAEVGAVGGRCMPTRSGPNGNVALDDTLFFHPVPAHGGRGAVPFSASCPSGSAVVGVRARAGARVDRIGPICANTLAWTNACLSNVATTEPPAAGGNGGFEQLRMCPRGELVVGLHVFESQAPQFSHPTVFGVVPICRAIDYPGPVAETCGGDLPIGFGP